MRTVFGVLFFLLGMMCTGTIVYTLCVRPAWDGLFVIQLFVFFGGLGFYEIGRTLMKEIPG